MLAPFKEALSKLCAFFCFWRSAAACCSGPASTPASIEDATAQPQNASENGGRSVGRQAILISTRELVPGEPPRTARVLKLWNKRRRSGEQPPKKATRSSEEDYECCEAVPMSVLNNNGAIVNGGHAGGVQVEVTIEGSN